MARPGGTRTFMFADLRDYTGFVEKFGDSHAARLIAAYNQLVRAEVAKAHGAQIKTEGDGYYVAFATAYDAVRCAVSILTAAELRSLAEPALPILVGVGLHAGEPVPQGGEFIGSAVIVAARIGSNATAGELLISDVVRGLLRTSGLPPLEERRELVLKGVTDPPRIFVVDWRRAGPAFAPGATKRTRTLRRPVLAALAVVLLLLLLLGAAAMFAPRSPSAPTPSPSAQGQLPPHGPLLFDLDRTPTGGQRVRVVVGNPDLDSVRFLGDAVQFTVSAGSWAAISVNDLLPDDFVAEYAVAPVSGSGSYALWFRGAEGRQVQAQVTTQSGALLIQTANSFDIAGTHERLFGPATRVPPTSDTAQRLAVAARRRDLVVYIDGAEIARATDEQPRGGAVGIVVNAAPDRAFTARLTLLRLYGP